MQAWPLMRNNIVREDLDSLIEYLKGTDPMLTQSGNVRAFEKEWSEWLGVKHSVFVNSGSSANLITMAALRELRGGGQVIVPTLTWVSDIASVLQNGFDPVFVDIDERTLGMDVDAVLKKITKKTRAVFLTHILGYNALNDKLLKGLKKAGVPLIEDVCESHGATHKGRKLGTFGLVSNFSFYYAHHMSTGEGGVVCTDDPEFYETERWGHFSYAIPVAPGKYTVTLHFIEHNPTESRSRHAALGPETESAERVFNVFCNGKTILANLNILDELGENRPLVRRMKGLQPNAQGKLMLEFVPVTGYATVTAIEVVPE